MKFSTLNVNFNSLIFDPLGSRNLTQAGTKEGYSPKSRYFAAVDSSSVITDADRHRLVAYRNKNC